MLRSTTDFGKAIIRSSRGIAAAAMIEPRETYFQITTTKAKMITSIRITIGDR